MTFFDTLPIWGTALLIFALRIVDVSLGTLRTIVVIQGRVAVAMLIGFAEVSIWVTAVSWVVSRVGETPHLILAYAGGFAAGNAVGIHLERWIGVGTCVVRIIAGEGGPAIVEGLRSAGRRVTEFPGTGPDGPCTLIFTTCRRREVGEVLRAARRHQPTLFYTVDRYSQTSPVGPLPHPTGWRAIWKKK